MTDAESLHLHVKSNNGATASAAAPAAQAAPAQAAAGRRTMLYIPYASASAVGFRLAAGREAVWIPGRGVAPPALPPAVPPAVPPADAGAPFHPYKPPPKTVGRDTPPVAAVLASSAGAPAVQRTYPQLAVAAVQRTYPQLAVVQAQAQPAGEASESTMVATSSNSGEATPRPVAQTPSGAGAGKRKHFLEGFVHEWQDRGNRNSFLLRVDDTVYVRETWVQCAAAIGEEGIIVAIYKPPNGEAMQIFVQLHKLRERTADGRKTAEARALRSCLATGTNQNDSTWMNALQKPPAEGGFGTLLRCKVSHLTKDVFQGGAWSKTSISNIIKGTNVTLTSSWAALDQLVGKSGVVVDLWFVTNKDSEYTNQNMVLVLLDDDSPETQRLVDKHGLRETVWLSDPGLQWLPAAEALHARRPMLCLDSHVQNDDAALEAAVSSLLMMRSGKREKRQKRGK